MSNFIIKNTEPLFIVRFIAAIGVVIYHYEPCLIQDLFVHRFIRKFDEFVNLFYFISGFVLVVSYRNYFIRGIFPKKEFWIKRLSRIYPVYIIALILTLLFHFFIDNIFSSIFLRLPFEIFMFQTWFCNTSINYPSWSISCEIFFYLIFPFFIPLLIKSYHKIKKIKIIIFYLLNLLFFTIIGVVLESYEHPYAKTIIGILNYHPIPRLGVFVLGTYCAYIYLNNSIFVLKKINSTILFLLSCVCIFISLFIIPEQSFYLKFGILAPIYFIFVLTICNVHESIRNFLSNNYFIYAGTLSYGIYIYQFPVFLFFNYYIGDTNNLNNFIFYVLILIIFSILSYEYIESPARTKINIKYLKTAEIG